MSLRNNERKQQYVIVTINVLDNYGNRLQNYALQEVLKRFGDVSTAQHLINAIDRKSYLKQFLKKYLGGMREAVSRSRRYGFLSGIAYAKRIQRTSQFNKKYIKKSPIEISAYKGMVPSNVDVDKFILGSDQIWNFPMLRITSPKEIASSFGDFAPSEKVVSYAASFGVSQLPAELNEFVRSGLEHVSEISVRELEGRDIVFNVSEKRAELVLDPTLLLTGNEWCASLPIKKIKKKYVLTYLLGDVSEDRRSTIKRFADERGLDILELQNPNDLHTSSSGPIEFVTLFANAQMVFTDSYHACCFSILFKRQFKVFGIQYGRDFISTNSRMRTLLDELGIESDFSDAMPIKRIDYRDVENRLTTLRDRSLSWIGAILTSDSEGK